MNKVTVVRALAVAVVLISCATTKVRLAKTAPATVNEESVRWSNDWGTATRGGFNLKTLEKLLKDNQIDPAQLSVIIDHDERHCSAKLSVVFLVGRFTYGGLQGSFSTKQEQPQHVTGMPTPKGIAVKCNHTASQVLALSVARSLRQMQNPQPPQQQSQPPPQPPPQPQPQPQAW